MSAEKSRRLKHINGLLLKSRLKRLVLAKVFETLLAAARDGSSARRLLPSSRSEHGVDRNVPCTRVRAASRGARSLLRRWSLTARVAEARRVALWRRAARLLASRLRRGLHAWLAGARQQRSRRARRSRAEARALSSVRLHVLILQWRLVVTAKPAAREDVALERGEMGQDKGEPDQDLQVTRGQRSVCTAHTSQVAFSLLTIQLPPRSLCHPRTQLPVFCGRRVGLQPGRAHAQRASLDLS